VDYPIKTLGQLRPILQGFRKAAGLTQAGMASHLGVTQQTYAQLEANPAAVSVDRLFRVLRVLQVDLTLIPRAAGASESDPAAEEWPQPPAARPAARKATVTRATEPDSTVTTRDVKRKTRSSRKQEVTEAAPARVQSPKPNITSRGAPKPKSVSKKRENW
jgi:HTH-type transcriptional regulator/antitoxin HipB